MQSPRRKHAVGTAALYGTCKVDNALWGRTSWVGRLALCPGRGSAHISLGRAITRHAFPLQEHRAVEQIPKVVLLLNLLMGFRVRFLGCKEVAWVPSRQTWDGLHWPESHEAILVFGLAVFM